MVEAEFQRDVIKAAIGAARRYNGTHYQRFLFVCGKLGIMEKQYRESRRFTQAMYIRHLLNMVRGESSAQKVYERLEREVLEHPTSNTGVNSDEQQAFVWFEEV